MSIANRYPLAVSYQLPHIQSVRQEVDLVSDPLGYDYFQYSGTPTLVDLDATGCLQDLLELVPTYPTTEDLRQDPLAIPKYWNESFERDDLDREKVLAFIRKWGRIGQLSPARDGIYELDNLLYATALGIFDEKRKSFDPGEIKLAFLKLMAEGKIIPFSWAQDSLRQIAKMARLTVNLERNLKGSELSIDFHRKNMKRLLASWNCLSIAIDDSVDISSPKYNLSEVWNQKPKGRENLLDENYCSRIYTEYIGNINHFLSPISHSVLTTTDFETLNRLKGSFETAFAGILYKFWTDEMRISQRCIHCNKPFIPIRKREDRKYCSNRCRETVNKKNYRQRNQAQKTPISTKRSTQPKRKEGK